MLLLSVSLPAAIVQYPVIASSTTTGWWHPIVFPAAVTGNLGRGDFIDDQQTGAQADNPSDIVGDTLGTAEGSNPGAYMAFFGDAGPVPNGSLAFRVRMGTGATGGYFKDVVHFGVDGDGNGTIDVYVSYVNNSGGTNIGSIRIYNVVLANNPVTGSVVGDSPNNSTPGTTFFQVTAVENNNLSYKPVNTNTATADTNHGGTGALTDVDGALTGVDYFLSYSISWATLQTQMSQLAGVTADPTKLRFFVASAKQPQSINQDIFGVNGQFTATQANQKWTQLGLITGTYSLQEVVATPEPGTVGLSLAALAGLWLRRRQRSSADHPNRA
jgi:hypothetical protein